MPFGGVRVYISNEVIKVITFLRNTFLWKIVLVFLFTVVLLLGFIYLKGFDLTLPWFNNSKESTYVKQEFENHGIITLQPVQNSSGINLVGLYQGLNDNDYKIQDLTGNEIAISKIGIKVWLLNSESKRPYLTDIPVLLELPNGKRVVMASSYEVFVSENDDIYSEQYVKEFLDRRLTTNQVIEMFVYLDSDDLNKDVLIYKREINPDSNEGRIYSVLGSYLDKTSADSNILDKYLFKKGGYLLPVDYSGLFYTEKL